MRKFAMVFLLLSITFLTGCKEEYKGQLDYPVELETSIGKILEDNEDWICSTSRCTRNLTNGDIVHTFNNSFDSNQANGFSYYFDNHDKIEKATFYLNKSRVNITYNGFSVDGTYCEIDNDTLTCEDESHIDDSTREKITDFRKYYENIVFDHINN